MGWVILAISMIFFLIVGDIDSQQNQTSRTAIQTQSGQLYASQILTIANRVNDWRYKTGQTNGTVPVDQLGLPFTPDARIQYRLLQSRLWVWMPEQAGLVDALRAQSRGSALIGTIIGTMRSGQLIWLSGLATGLTAPQGVLKALWFTSTNPDFPHEENPFAAPADGVLLCHARRLYLL